MGLDYTRSINSIVCPRCKRSKGHDCITPQCKKIWPPHLSRIQAYRKKFGEAEIRMDKETAEKFRKPVRDYQNAEREAIKKCISVEPLSKTIFIEVSSVPGAGKSTIAQILKLALEDQGMSVIVHDPDLDRNLKILERAIQEKALRGRQVVISTKQILKAR